jgi:hypothetical protein
VMDNMYIISIVSCKAVCLAKRPRYNRYTIIVYYTDGQHWRSAYGQRTFFLSGPCYVFDFKVLKIGSNSDFAELPIPAILYYYYNTYIIIFMHCYTRIVRYIISCCIKITTHASIMYI